jgi:hypothetical protein
MIDNRDSLLTHLFAEQAPSERAPEFLAQFVNRLDRDQSIRRTLRTGIIVAGVIIAALLAPWIAAVAVLTIGSVAGSFAASRSLVSFPMAWPVVFSIIASFLPVIYLGITRRW